ncbi:hypothetical protein LENED_007922 [Lentinula edodes]|uniref:Uncharacterized protein n=1 Tax=Lentinula edodes TaxID=5353 RepID=A0A1Q3EFT7_LENED|nr:hypothetical protein LENED_007922 [Lentinula edodes]
MHTIFARHSGSADCLVTTSTVRNIAVVFTASSRLVYFTTRTTSLTSVPHKAFALRFSDLTEIEAACREDEEERAVRTLDWIGLRINSRSAQWVDDMDKMMGKQSTRVPWWEELKRCVEGDHVPSKTETWNHPIAIIFAVSTNTSNPLQIISNLHSRAIELPSWVDSAYLSYTLIVHPKDSTLSDEEAGALFNAVKKQYGLHSYLLSLDMPNPPPAPVPVPTAKPRLPLADRDSPELSTKPVDSSTRNGASSGINTIRMNEKDIQQTAKFTREFLVMSLIPWMEKRLPSRLFSSTRRLFGTPSPSPTPPPSHRSSASRSSTYNGTSVSIQAAVGSPSQQRRLAEFATILGDFKLAVTVWETLSKEGKGGSDILPLLLSPSPAIPLHVANTFATMFTQPTEPFAKVQLRALLCAIRWEVGIDPSDFASELLEGERWLVWAAGSAEEPPSALLLAHAAFISSRRQALRRAALWYLMAANRLEKCETINDKELSPSFWDAEGEEASNSRKHTAIKPVIEHSLGRLLYSTGHTQDAVKIFLSLLEASTLSPVSPAVSDDDDVQSVEVYLEDFRTAFEHLRANTPNLEQLNDFHLPFTFCLASQSCFRFTNDNIRGESSEWEKREEAWSRFNKSRGVTSRFATNQKAYVNEPFWVDLVLKNPLDVNVTLTDVTLVIRESNVIEPSPSKLSAEIEVIEDVIIGAKETRTISISIKAIRPASLTITHTLRNQVVDYRLCLSSIGVESIDEVWLVVGSDNLWLDEGNGEVSDEMPAVESIHSSNSSEPFKPFNIPLGSSFSLAPAESLEVSLTFHALDFTQKDIHLLLLYRETPQAPFKQVRKVQTCSVHPLFRITSLATPSTNVEAMYLLHLELQNISNSVVRLTQISTVSPSWICDSSIYGKPGSIFPLQLSRFVLGINPWDKPSGCRETFEFVLKQLAGVIHGRAVDLLNPPPLDLCCSHSIQGSHSLPLNRFAIPSLIHSGKRHAIIGSRPASYPHIPSHTHPHIFPLFNPAALDVLVFWEIPAENRSGNILISGLILGATHSPLRDIIRSAENSKITRSMYAETQRKKEEILEDIRNSEWNMEMNPLHVIIHTNDVSHDFATGPYRLRVHFTVRNYSTTLQSRFTLKLNDTVESKASPSDEQAIIYSGRLTFRAKLEPSHHTAFVATAWIKRPGTYVVGAWCMETEVFELSTDTVTNVERVRYRYIQNPLDNSHLVHVCHVPGSSRSQ